MNQPPDFQFVPRGARLKGSGFLSPFSWLGNGVLPPGSLNRNRPVEFLALALLICFGCFITPLSAQTQSQSAPSLLVTGNLDLRVIATSNAIDFALHDIVSDRALVAEELVLSSDGVVEDVVPELPDFAFLGQAGAPVWIWPQLLSVAPGSSSGHLFLGARAAQVEPGIYVDDLVEIEFLAVDGPGRIAAYFDIAGFPAPPVWVGDRQTVLTNVPVQLVNGLHLHMNWAFTKPGRYQIELRAVGTKRGNNVRVPSSPIRVALQVPDWGAGRRRVVTGGSSIILVNFNSKTGAWEPRIEVSKSSKVDGYPLFNTTQFDPARVILRYVVTSEPRPEGLVSASAHTRWENTGVAAGDALFRLQGMSQPSSGPGALLLGSTVQAGTFVRNPYALGSGGNNDWVTAGLESVTGPGAVSAWVLTGTAAAPVPFFAYSTAFPSNTVESLLAGVPNVFPVRTPGLWDLNWGFSRAGDYELFFSGSGNLEPGLAGTLGVGESRSKPFSIRVEIREAAAGAMLLRPRISGSGAGALFEFDIQGTAGAGYRVQRSGDLSTWVDVRTLEIPSSGLAAGVSSPIQGASLGWYRVLPSVP